MTNVDVALSRMSSEGSNDSEVVMADSCVGVVDVTNLATTTLLILLGEEKATTFESIANIIITA